MYCQNQIEDNGVCTTQCEHCKKYYAPLELEEAADKFAKTTIPENSFEEGLSVGKALGFIAGAKFQANRMYSEDEVKHIIEKLVRDCYFMQEPNQDVAKWFEQFKKDK